MYCQTCGCPTEVVARFIGFWGLRETFGKWCRTCLPQAAAEADLPVDDVLAEYDERVAAVKAAREEYERRRGRR